MKCKSLLVILGAWALLSFGGYVNAQCINSGTDPGINSFNPSQYVVNGGSQYYSIIGWNLGEPAGEIFVGDSVTDPYAVAIVHGDWWTSTIQQIAIDVPQEWESTDKCVFVRTCSGGVSECNPFTTIHIQPAPEPVTDPYINNLSSMQVARGTNFTIYGGNFGVNSNLTGAQVRIGTRTAATNSLLGKGINLPVIRSWNNTAVRVKLKDSLPNATNPTGWDNKLRFVWVEVNGVKSNYMPFTVLPQ